MTRWERRSRREAGPRGGPFLRRLVVVAVIVYAVLFAWTGYRLGEAGTAFRSGRLEEARRSLENAAFWRVRSARVDDALGVVALALGRIPEAEAHLARARGRWSVHSAAFGEGEVLESFLHEGRFEAAALYSRHRRALAPTPAIAFYQGAASLALGRPAEAEPFLATAAADADWAARAETLIALARLRLEAGRQNVVFDRNEAPLAAADSDTSSWTFDSPGMRALLEGPFLESLPPDEARGRIDLTIDRNVDLAARRALGTRRGALVVLDARDGAILAAASVPEEGDAGGPPALVRRYEPGSIVKMITLAAALRGGLDVDAPFPMQCPGWIAVGGRAFRDWITHGRIESIDEAVAVSCNIVFGRLGMELGRGALDAELERWGFAEDADHARHAADGIPYRTGNLIPLEADAGPFEIARRAEGLDSIEITPIHAAMLAAGLARGGAVPTPWILARSTSVLGTIRRASAPAPLTSPLDEAPAQVLRRGMVRTVTDPRGTGRRAAIEGLTLALKTGTSGRNPPGFDALIIGFAPADTPRLAWALVAEGAGKAELEGARITREFLEGVAPLLK